MPTLAEILSAIMQAAIPVLAKVAKPIATEGFRMIYTCSEQAIATIEDYSAGKVKAAEVGILFKGIVDEAQVALDVVLIESKVSVGELSRDLGTVIVSVLGGIVTKII